MPRTSTPARSRRTISKPTPKSVVEATASPSLSPSVSVTATISRPKPAPPARSSKAPSPRTMLTQDQIARRAYLIWERKGFPFGQDEQNWQEAITELTMAA